MNNSDNVINEFSTLPSQGKVYQGKINPDITLRSMKTVDEMKRLNTTPEKQYLMLCNLIDDCTVSEKQMSSYDMCLGDYQYLLHRLRVATYGNKYKMHTNCPFCLSTEDNEIDLDSINVIPFDEESINKCIEFTLPKTEHVIRIKHQTPRLLDAITKALIEDKKRTKMDRGLVVTLARVIDTVDGQKYDIVKLEEFVEKLPMADTNSILKHSEKLTKLIGLDLDITVECEVCGYQFPTTFRTTSEFFGPSVDI